MFKRKGMRNLAGILAGSMLLSTFSVTGMSVMEAHADNVSISKRNASKNENSGGISQSEVERVSSDTFDPSQNVKVTDQNLKDAKAYLSEAGFTSQDFAQLTNKELVYTYQQAISPKPAIGGTAVAKGILKVWHKLPSSVKKKIGAYGGLSGFLKLVDHYTGTEYHIIYSACRKMGMSKGIADFVTKTLTLLI